MATHREIKWREANDQECLWIVNLAHFIPCGLSDFIEHEAEEMYGEFFDVPLPEQLISVSWF